MAKLQIELEKFISFGLIFLIIEHFDSVLFEGHYNTPCPMTLLAAKGRIGHELRHENVTSYDCWGI